VRPPYELSALQAEDGPALAAAYERNREHLRPWDPVRPPAFFSVEDQRGGSAEPRGVDLGMREAQAMGAHVGRVAADVSDQDERRAEGMREVTETGASACVRTMQSCSQASAPEPLDGFCGGC
jgi:hypothetical protein